MVQPISIRHSGIDGIAKGTMTDLVRFSLVPKVVSYNFRIFCSLVKLSSVAGMNTPTSSANNLWQMVRLSDIRIPFTSPVPSFDWIQSMRGWVERAKISGESGQPCWMPLVMWICPVKCPFKWTFEVAHVRGPFTSVRNLPPRPTLLKTTQMYSCSTWSKAFSKSSFKKRGRKFMVNYPVMCHPGQQNILQDMATRDKTGLLNTDNV